MINIQSFCISIVIRVTDYLFVYVWCVDLLVLIEMADGSNSSPPIKASGDVASSSEEGLVNINIKTLDSNIFSFRVDKTVLLLYDVFVHIYTIMIILLLYWLCVCILCDTNLLERTRKIMAIDGLFKMHLCLMLKNKSTYLVCHKRMWYDFISLFF